MKVAEVVPDKIAHGWSPEEIHFQHSHLSLPQIHAALDAQIQRGLEESGKLSAQVSDADLRRKLSNLKSPR